MFSSVYVAGHRGMVGSAVCRRLAREHGCRLITATRAELNLENALAVQEFFKANKPEAVVFAAARVGGIQANRTYPVEFLVENLYAQLATINAAYHSGVKRFLFLGSTCIYPRLATQPITEDQLLGGPLEPTNEAYALAKICGLKLCQFYRREYGRLFHSAMPTNLYGPGDNYHPANSHVFPALLRRIHEAKQSGAPSITIWGTGSPQREFLYVDDLADALVHLLQIDDPPDWVNVGMGEDLSIIDLARMIAEVVGYNGKIMTDPSKPDGTPRKLTDISLIKSTGWSPTTSLKDGVRYSYAAFLNELAQGTMRDY